MLRHFLFVCCFFVCASSQRGNSEFELKCSIVSNVTIKTMTSFPVTTLIPGSGYVYNGEDILAVVFQQMKIKCEIISKNGKNIAETFPGVPLKKENQPTLLIKVYNSTWQQQYDEAVMTDTTSWISSINSDNFFNNFTWRGFPLYNVIYRNNLNWVIEFEAKHFALNTVLRKRLLAIRQDSVLVLHPLWGTPIPIPSYSSYESVAAASPPLIVPTPCLPGCFLLVLSNQQRTYIASTCGGFDSDLTSWYQWNCILPSPLSCRDLVISSGLLTSNRLLLLTEVGLMVSNILTAKQPAKFLNFTLITDSFPRGINWSASKLSHFPLCSVADHVPNDDPVFIKAITSTGERVFFMARDPFLSWKSLSRVVTTPSNDLSVVYDQQVRTLVVIRHNSAGAFAEVYTLDGGPIYPRFSFPSCGGPIHALMLSNHYLYVTIGGCLWLSTDGGNRFMKIHELNSMELVISMVGCELDHSLAIMTSQGRVFWGKTGLLGLRLALDNLNTARAVLGFDLVCDVMVINNQPKGAAPHVTYRRVMDQNGTCSHLLQPVVFPHFVSYTRPDHAVQLQLSLSSTNSYTWKAKAPLSIHFGNPQMFEINRHIDVITPHSFTITLEVKSKFLLQAVTSATVSLRNLDDVCCVTSLNFLVIAGCSNSLRLFFNYSSFLPAGVAPLSYEQFISNVSLPQENELFTLPVNYRPPSSLAISIPLSTNVYNADSELFINDSYSSYYFETKPRLKEFCGKDRSKCQCSNFFKFSSLEQHSDCKEKVYQVLFDTPYPIRISIQSTDDRLPTPTLDLSRFYVFIEEVNGRDASVYSAYDEGDPCLLRQNGLVCRAISDNQDTSLLSYMTSSRNSTLYSGDSLVMQFAGTGLFHFRVTLINGIFFCPLRDEFQVYVVNPPLPFPSGVIIRGVITVGTGVFLVFMYERYLMLSISAKQQALRAKAGQDYDDDEVQVNFVLRMLDFTPCTRSLS